MEKRPNEENQTSARAKVQKMNDQRKSQIAFDQNPSPDIFKLHAIACSELFDYLSLRDIHSMGGTCKRFNRIAGKYFQDNYSAAEPYIAENGQIHCNYIPINAFSQYVQQIDINTDKIGLDLFKYIGANCKSLKKIHLSVDNNGFDEAKLDFIKEILPKIEDITLLRSLSKDDYDNVLKHCSNLKRLNINFQSFVDKAWLHQKYEMLEHVSIPYEFDRTEDYKNFLEQNPNIRSVSCEANFLIKNEDWLLTTVAKLDYLDIDAINAVNPKQLCSLLNQLHGREFYKKLLLSVNTQSQHFINEIGKLSTVERLSIWDYYGTKVDFPIMADVKEMALHTDESSSLNIEEFVTKFPNVERVYLWGLSIEKILVMLKGCKKLKELKFSFYGANCPPLNLYALNKEREKLAGANKMTIYLHNKLFLATKWANNNRDFQFIEIKRKEYWPHEF